MKRIKLLEVRSELGAGTRGAGMGPDALRVACLNKGSDYFRRYHAVVLPDLNHVLFEKNHFPFARHIDSIYSVQKGIASAVEQTLRFGEFPLVLAGDHSSANATIAGIKAAYPAKTLGVIWIDAHADIHSPYTTPSGNVHGMPLAAALGHDNRACQRNEPDAETVFFWQRLQNLGEPGPKLRPEHLVYVVVRDTEEQEDALIAELGIKWIKLPEIKEKGSRQLTREIYEHLRFCDMVYISFDVDSLDSSFSIGTGTPVEDGLYLSEAENLCQDLLENERVVCFEMVEINPTLDNGNTMAKNAFNILEKATEAIERRLRQREVVSRLGRKVPGAARRSGVRRGGSGCGAEVRGAEWRAGLPKPWVGVRNGWRGCRSGWRGCRSGGRACGMVGGGAEVVGGAAEAAGGRAAGRGREEMRAKAGQWRNIRYVWESSHP